jgi:DNA-binding transcriptional LysR family regulator
MRHLATFLTVARLQSFTGAAAELGYAQSTITGQVKGLESDLGAELLDRTTARVTLTPAGERLLPYAEQIVDLSAEARLAVHEAEEAAGTVSVGSIESIATYRLSTIVEFFHHRFPDLRLVVRVSSCPDTLRALRQGEFDVGFLMSSQIRYPGLKGITLSEEELVAVAATDHPLARAADVSTSELRAATILNTEYGCPYRELFEAALNEDSEEKIHLLEFGTIEAIKQMAAAGLGVTVLPRFAVSDELAAGALAEVAWKVPFTMISHIAWHKDKWISKTLRLFMDEAVKVFREGA